MRNRKGRWSVALLAFLIVSLAIFSPVYAEEELPLIELQRFTRGLKEFLQEEEERMVVKDGVYIDVDTLFSVRRPIPDLPLIISANATDKDKLILKEVKLLSPERAPIRSFALERALKPVGRSFSRLRVLREEMRHLERRIALEGRITLQDKKTLSRIQQERAKLFYEAGGVIGNRF